MGKAVNLVAILIILLVASISGAVAYNTIVTVPGPSITPSPSPTAVPSATTTATQTPHPTIQPTVVPTPDTPTVTPIPTIPTCKIAYYERSRTYDVDNNVTKIQIEIVIKTQGTSDSDGSYGFNYYNFYLAENGVPIPNQSMYGVTNHTVILSSANGVIGDPTFQIIGNHSSTGYQLSYDNFPIQASWSKEQQPINIIFF
jgi:hypothetical protein